MNLAWYITAHGRGHASRALRILRRLPPATNLFLRTGVPRGFFRARLSRPFSWAPVICDTGPVHTETGAIDFPRTTERYERIEEENRTRKDPERLFLRENRIHAVVCDIPPWPLEIAAAEGIPGIATVNFTWVEILEPAAADSPRTAALVERLRRSYRAATVALRTPPALEMPAFERVVDVPLITVPGRSRREEMARSLGIPRNNRWIYLYFGEFGIDWVPPETFRSNGSWTFLTRHRPARPVEGLVVLPADDLPHEDIVASADVVLAKPGYGILTECMSNGTPLVTTSREDFAEYHALESAMRRWGGAVIVPADVLLRGEWSGAIARAERLRPEPDRSDGAGACVRAILECARAGDPGDA